MKTQLHRSMGLADVALFFVIASTNLQWVAASAAAGPGSIFAWVAGCLALFAPLCIVVVYLSRRYPREGGMYVWSARAFGPYAGFITAWTYWFSTLAYFPGLLYFTAGSALFATHTHSAPPIYFIAVALGGLLIGTLLNVLGLETGKRLINLAAVARTLAIVFLAGFGLVALAHHHVATPVTAAALLPHFNLQELVFLSFIALAFSGPEALPFMAEEVRDPQRSIPRGLAAAAPLVLAIYIIGTLGVFALLPSARTDSLYGVVQAFSAATQSGGGFAFLVFLVALVVISCLGSLTAWLGANARLPFVAGIDNYLPSTFGYLHPRYRSPVTSLWVQFGIAAVLVVLGQSGTTVKGAYDILVNCTVLATMLPFLLMFLSAVKIGWGKPGIVVAACVGFCTAAAAVVLAAFPNQDDPAPLLAVAKIVGLNVVMLAIGTAFFFLRTRQLARRALARQASGA